MVGVARSLHDDDCDHDDEDDDGGDDDDDDDGGGGVCGGCDRSVDFSDDERAERTEGSCSCCWY